jgi:hypothetical protein
LSNEDGHLALAAVQHGKRVIAQGRSLELIAEHGSFAVGKELRALLKALGAACGIADLDERCGAGRCRGAGILAEQATLLMTSTAMPAWRSHGGIVRRKESGAEKAEDMREEGRGR